MPYANKTSVTVEKSRSELETTLRLVHRKDLVMTDTDTDTDLGIDLESLLGEQDPDDCAHIVRRSEHLGAGQIVELAAAEGIEVVGLCGRRWVPKGFAPENLPPCRRCVEIWQSMTGSGA